MGPSTWVWMALRSAASEPEIALPAGEDLAGVGTAPYLDEGSGTNGGWCTGAYRLISLAGLPQDLVLLNAIEWQTLDPATGTIPYRVYAVTRTAPGTRPNGDFAQIPALHLLPSPLVEGTATLSGGTLHGAPLGIGVDARKDLLVAIGPLPTYFMPATFPPELARSDVATPHATLCQVGSGQSLSSSATRTPVAPAIRVSVTLPSCRTEDCELVAGGQRWSDADCDGVADGDDNCVDQANADQANADADPAGDVCDACPGEDDALADVDLDGICAAVDTCPNEANPSQDPADDPDADHVCTVADNCPYVDNPDQADTWGGDPGDACEVCSDPCRYFVGGAWRDDRDCDGWLDADDGCPDDPDPTNACGA